MKRLMSIFITILVLGFGSFAQAPHPPSSGHGQTANQAAQTGGGAPIEGGLIVYFLISTLYLISKKRKFFIHRIN